VKRVRNSGKLGNPLGAFSAGMCPPDETTFDYVRQRTDAEFEPVYADGGAGYVEEYRFDVSKLEPLVAAPHSPDNRKTARECRDVKIDRVYIG
jgi:3-isopropylmalate/(R)-2-methylmalate dehydratase large subunit